MLNYQEIPANYVYCFADKNTCPLATTCLRAQATQWLKQNPSLLPCVKAVSPFYIQQHPSPQQCEFYRSSLPIQFAQGMTHLFDEIPHALAHKVRRAVISCFSCESYFYQSRKGERLISPTEQALIQQVFQEFVPEIKPKYDRFVEKEEW